MVCERGIAFHWLAQSFASIGSMHSFDDGAVRVRMSQAIHFMAMGKLSHWIDGWHSRHNVSGFAILDSTEPLRSCRSLAIPVLYDMVFDVNYLWNFWICGGMDN